MNIEPQDFINNVIKAYAKTKLVPATGLMFRQQNGNNCACAIGVLYCEENGVPTHNTYNYIEDEPKNQEIWNWAKKKFGEKFVNSFWPGFDGTSPRYSDSDIYNLARETKKKVFELYNKGELYG